MKNWYRVQAKGSAAEILIYDEIGMFGIGAKNFIADLKALGNVTEITLGINSPGGDVFDGVAIYNALKRHQAKITGRVDGIAASIASVILMASDKIVMPDNTMLLIHNPWGGAIGDAEDMRDFAEALDKIKVAILAAYRRSGKSDEELSAIMDAETWLTAEEALAGGFADEVIQSVDIAALFDLGNYQKAPDRLRAKPAPELNTRRPEEEAAQYTSRVLSLCTAAGVPELAPKLIEKKMSIVDVEQRLVEAPSIRAICAAAKGLGIENAERRAHGYIMAGCTKDEARHNLMEVLQAIQGPEIDNKCFDMGSRSAPAGRDERFNPSRVAEIYARRNSRTQKGAEELARKLAKVISEHGTLR